jgi:tetratricopeptide (TPR) repeat protein
VSAEPPDRQRFEADYGAALAALREGRPAAAETRLRAIQARMPGEVNSLRVLGLALRAQARAPEALEALERAVRLAPDFAHAWEDLGFLYVELARFEPAEQSLKRALALDAGLHRAWRRLGDVLVERGQHGQARAAFDRSVATDPHRARFEAAAAALARGDRHEAEGIFRGLLRADDADVGALCGLAALAVGAGRPRDAERLLRHALKQVAHMPLVWRGLAQALLDAGRHVEADAAIRRALQVDPESAASWVIQGSVAAHRLQGEAALGAFDRALALHPGQVRVLLSKGHVLKTLGRRAECETAYRACLALDPNFGEAYCSLADLKTYRFADAELAAMEALAAAGPAPADAAPLEFALGRAFEQRGEWAKSFRHYASGNAAKRRTAGFDAAAFEQKSRRVAQRFDAEFLRRHAADGCADPAPIFIVGLPRSGSTLVEQILASHPQVQGTMELPNLVTIVRELDHWEGGSDTYPECLGALPPAAFERLGQRYVDETRDLRGGRPRFIDKMPNNFSHVGLLALILPRATIIDVRRHPLDACWSAFKQYFAEGQSFSYDLEDLGRYYRSYLELMDHWQAVLPGKVLCVSYERLVRDTEAEVRRLLGHCGLPFDAATLRFHETRRSVRTASSEQVRQPIYASGIGQWRHVRAELEPLRRSLGDVLERFPEH